MCGILGIIHLDGSPHPSRLIDTLTDLLHHRGPDGRGIYIHQKSGVALGHRRLSIIDLHTGDQPIYNETKEIVIVFNGEIYNYQKLRAELMADGHRFYTESDTEVLVHLYEKHGAQMVDFLDGMFAFIIHDQKQNTILVANDKVGKKPIYWIHQNNLLVFASELAPILNHPDIDVDIDPSQLPTYFCLGYFPAPNTIYKNIRRFKPSTLLKIHLPSRSITQKRYWSYPLIQQSMENRTQDIPEQCRNLIINAVKKRLVSDVPVGVFLSGGIDSSIVVAEMRQLYSGPIHTFTVGFSQKNEFDETALARQISTQFATTHHEILLESHDITAINHVIDHYGEPNADASAIPTYIISRETVPKIKVILNGDGGDELFCGYTRFIWMLLANKIPKPLAGGLNTCLSLINPGKNNYRLTKLSNFFAQAGRTDPIRLGYWISFLKPDVVRELIRSNNQEPATDQHLLSSYSNSFTESKKSHCSYLNQILHANFENYLANDLIPKVERMSMANSQEIRSPFLDTDLISYVATITQSKKINGLNKKALLKAIYHEILPKNVLYGPKKGFGLPLDEWFRGPLREELLDLTSQSRGADFLNQQAIQKLIDQHLSGQNHHGFGLYSIYVFLKWWEKYKTFKTQPLPAHE